ncbi:polymorphic toxin-type HINT domain-containing protein [Dactylosporangium cerinum]|uniref:Polymorphic toxin-type HINT domain-containing protein n=1 Tax=Dactylosporangium cerinum TaxID=1434730 RepID=A0ABV9WIK0_9ACTN
MLETTDHHPFWSDTTNNWVDAAKLTPGDRLRAADHRTMIVLKVYSRIQAKLMRDLTVAAVHTYYVIAGESSILVHNCDNDDHRRASQNIADVKKPKSRQLGGVLHIETANGTRTFDLRTDRLHPAVSALINRFADRLTSEEGKWFGSHLEIQAAFLMRRFALPGSTGRLMMTFPSDWRQICIDCRGAASTILRPGMILNVRTALNGNYVRFGTIRG